MALTHTRFIETPGTVTGIGADDAADDVKRFLTGVKRLAPPTVPYPKILTIFLFLFVLTFSSFFVFVPLLYQKRKFVWL